MEALYGVMLLITFILGVGIGLLIPILVKKYVKVYESEKETIKEEKEESKPIDNTIPYIPKDLLNEWLTGEVTGKELKPNDEQ